MAKYECNFTGSFKEFLCIVEEKIINSSDYASLEECSDYQIGDVFCAVRVFEKYSMIGGKHASLSLTLLGNGDKLFLSAITSGGNLGVVFKIRTFGEKAFLDCLIQIVENYRVSGTFNS